MAFICVLDCTTEKKVFQLKNLRFFSFKCLICDFSQRIFILQQCLDPNPNPNFFSDSDSAKIFGFFRVQNTTTLVAAHSNMKEACTAVSRHPV
jgi:hypothetical protein